MSKEISNEVEELRNIEQNVTALYTLIVIPKYHELQAELEKISNDLNKELKALKKIENSELSQYFDVTKNRKIFPFINYMIDAGYDCEEEKRNLDYFIEKDEIGLIDIRMDEEKKESLIFSILTNKEGSNKVDYIETFISDVYFSKELANNLIKKRILHKEQVKGIIINYLKDFESLNIPNQLLDEIIKEKEGLKEKNLTLFLNILDRFMINPFYITIYHDAFPNETDPFKGLPNFLFILKEDFTIYLKEEIPHMSFSSEIIKKIKSPLISLPEYLMVYDLMITQHNESSFLYIDAEKGMILNNSIIKENIESFTAYNTFIFEIQPKKF